MMAHGCECFLMVSDVQQVSVISSGCVCVGMNIGSLGFSAFACNPQISSLIRHVRSDFHLGSANLCFNPVDHLCVCVCRVVLDSE